MEGDAVGARQHLAREGDVQREIRGRGGGRAHHLGVGSRDVVAGELPQACRVHEDRCATAATMRLVSMPSHAHGIGIEATAHITPTNVYWNPNRR